MTAGEVYISGIYQNGEIGDKLGVRTKWRGEEWSAASFILPVASLNAQEAYRASWKGYRISRHQFPEAEAVWDEKGFSRARDFLWLSGFLAIKEKVAEVLRHFNLGGGELVPVPLFKADLVTPWEEPFYYINYGRPKDTFLPDESRSIEIQIPRPPPKKSTYNVYSPDDGDIALSSAARSGADIWIEEYVFSKLFLNGALVDALQEAKVDVDLRLARCRIVGG